MGVRATAFVIVLTAFGCAKQGAVVPEPARLKVVSTPPDASVYIDGHYFGRATGLSQEPKALQPGAHLMTIVADDHFPHDMELNLPPGTTTLTIELRPVPP